MQCWSEIETQIATRSRILLGVGFDGLPSENDKNPNGFPSAAGIRSLLAKLGASPRVSLAFISGRPLRDIHARVGLESAFYAGNHGMEILGPGLASYDGLAMSCRSELVDARVFLVRSTLRLREIQIKDNGLTVRVSWRSSDLEQGAMVRRLIEEIVRDHPRLTVTSRPGEWELRPRAAWHKGNALQQILANLHMSPADTIYIGDEFTDEEAFIHLLGGLTFCVGTNARTAARYRLEPSQAGAFLFCVLRALNGMRLT